MLREFTDRNGQRWRVWDVTPSVRPFTPTAPDASPGASPGPSPFPTFEFSDGWLCFETTNEKRRLAPIPAEWETCPPDVLEELCTRAGFATRHTPPTSGPPTPQPPAA